MSAPKTVEEAMSVYNLKTEGGVQNVLYTNLSHRNHRLIVPNCQTYGWESDMVSATRKGFVTEYEIKLNRSDFKADFRKLRHRRFLEIEMWRKRFPFPNRFVYVTPEGMVAPDELPPYAGLIVFKQAASPYLMLADVVRPPMLHPDPINDVCRQQLERGLVFRYWRERIKFVREA